MRKTRVVIGMVAALVVCLGGAASAEIFNGVDYDFVDTIDDWTVFGFGVGAVPIVEGFPLNYTHDITGFGIPDQYLATEAWLNLDFTNDVTDSVKTFRGSILLDKREYVRVGFDGTDWTNVGEVDSGQYDLIVAVDRLNDDGLLHVTIEASNPGWNLATAYLDHSVLYGNVQAVPLPAAILLGAIGLVAAGRKLRQVC